jgi:hypothetical protein
MIERASLWGLVGITVSVGALTLGACAQAEETPSPIVTLSGGSGGQAGSSAGDSGLGGSQSSGSSGSSTNGTAGDGGAGGMGPQAGASGSSGTAGTAGVSGSAGTAGSAGSAQNTGPTVYPLDHVHSPITPSVIKAMQETIAKNPARESRVFMKVGASGTKATSYLSCFAGSNLDWATHTDLQPTWNYFMQPLAAGTTPYERDTLAAKIGVSVGWSITGSPSPIEQEMAAINPQLATVAYGTNDMNLGLTYQSAIWGFGEKLMTLIDTLTDQGVIPILVSVQHRLDEPDSNLWIPSYNMVIRGIAQSKQVPWLNLSSLYKTLPNWGLASDGLHGASYSNNGSKPCVFTDEALQFGTNQRNFQTMIALDRIRQGLEKPSQPLDDPGPPLTGTGTAQDPLNMGTLPFSDRRSTLGITSTNFNTYDGCQASQDESGPEIIYHLHLDQTTPIRAMVFSRDGVDVDIHLLKDQPTTANCIARNNRILEQTLEAGDYYFSLDSYVSQGKALAGEYLFTVLACEPGDNDCK